MYCNNIFVWFKLNILFKKCQISITCCGQSIIVLGFKLWLRRCVYCEYLKLWIFNFFEYLIFLIFVFLKIWFFEDLIFFENFIILKILFFFLKISFFFENFIFSNIWFIWKFYFFEDLIFLFFEDLIFFSKINFVGYLIPQTHRCLLSARQTSKQK